MWIIVRQFNRPVLCRGTRSRKRISDRDLRMARQEADSCAAVTSGYYDVVLSRRPDDPAYDVDSAIEVK